MSNEIVESGESNEVQSVVSSMFPKGMKVLVVDDSRVCLKVVTNLLLQCQYKVTSTSNPIEALTLLEKNEENFDLVLSDVYMEKIDGFKLLEASRKHDIPVIMMSGRDDEEIVEKGVMHGARNYLLKPVRLAEIKVIWQHVFRKIFNKNCSINEKEKIRDDNEDQNDNNNNNNSNNNKCDKHHKASNVTMKKRIRWDTKLHDEFVAVITELGGKDKAVPKKIKEMLGKKYNLTREQVANHLQKYRKGLSSKHKAQNGRKNNVNEHSLIVANTPIASSSNQTIVSPMLMNRNHLPPKREQATTVQDYAHLSNNNRWMINNQVVDHQPQPLQIRPSPMIMQQQQQQQPLMMQQFGRNFVGCSNLAQGNHHHYLQQQQQQIGGYGDFRSLHSNYIDSCGIMQGTDASFDNCPSVINPCNEIASGNNGLLIDANYKASFEDFSRPGNQITYCFY